MRALLTGAVLFAAVASASVAQAQTNTQVSAAMRACFSYAFGIEPVDGGLAPEQAGLAYVEQHVADDGDVYHRYRSADGVVAMSRVTDWRSDGAEHFTCNLTLNGPHYDAALRATTSLIAEFGIQVGAPEVHPTIRDTDRTRRQAWSDEGAYNDIAISIRELAPSTEGARGGVSISLDLGVYPADY